MSLSTHSKFYFGYTIDGTNFNLDFDEGGGELTAELRVGDYTLTDIATEVARALNTIGSLNYVVTVDRETRKLTISGDSNFDLLISSGSNNGDSGYGVIGFSGADVTGDDNYESNASAGSVYSTQFILQSYVSSENSRGFAYATVNKSASGKKEVVAFGEEKFLEFNLKYVTDILQGSGGPIRSDASGVSKLRSFIRYLITLGPVEFMPDEDDVDTFESVQLETTVEDTKGTKYKLKEQLGQNLPGYFETGLLTFRNID